MVKSMCVGTSHSEAFVDCRSFALSGNRVRMASLQILLALIFTKFRNVRQVWTRSRKLFVGTWEMILRSISEGMVVRRSRGLTLGFRVAIFEDAMCDYRDAA